MKNKLRKLVTATSLLALSVGIANAGTLDDISKAGELRACFDAGYMPFEMKAKNGNYIGFDVDLGKLMAKQMGVKYVPVEYCLGWHYTCVINRQMSYYHGWHDH